MSDLESQLRKALLRYTSGEIELDEFQEWFVGTLWTMEEASPACPLANEIEGILSESSTANWSEDDLRATLRRILAEHLETAHHSQTS